jgi:hypothetical protein
MKKTLIIATVLFATAFAGSALAATITSESTTTIGGAAFVPSTGVTVQALASATAYAVQSKHLSGNKQYGTKHDMSEIDAVDAAVGDECVAPSSATELSM